MATYTGGHERTEGPQCRQCKATEARCAWRGQCCGACSHFRWLDEHGNELSTNFRAGAGAHQKPATMREKQREIWRLRARERYARKKVS